MRKVDPSTTLNNPQWVQGLRSSSQADVNDLDIERAGSGIDVDHLAAFLFSEQSLKQRARILNVLRAERLFDKSRDHFKDRISRIKTSLARGKRLWLLARERGWSEDEIRTAGELVGEQTPYRLHAGMFMVTLQQQASDEQQQTFLSKARRYQYIGCYAQTELGHGSNVRGLETTATWNPDDQTFSLHTPKLSAAKWWIGSLGRTANHAIVMAQLLIEGESYGPHLFIVQIRDLVTHQPLDDIHVGDIGPKFGFNTMDNGFLLFNNKKIPHFNMLARFAKVDPDTGRYTRPADPALLYGTMTWVRSNIVLSAGSVLAQGVTIATRYCAVRRQFRLPDLGVESISETQVLDYTMVQQRLFPLLATSYALHFTGQSMIDLYNNRNAGKKDRPQQLYPDRDLLADLHATSCALKAYASTTAGEGLETCRRACGGHGYSSFSGLGTKYADYLPTLTWEGDNYMLTQQVARYFIKVARRVLNQKDIVPSNVENDTVAVIARFRNVDKSERSFNLLDEDEDVVAAFAQRTAYFAYDLLNDLDVKGKSWNSSLTKMWKLSTAHAQYITVKTFHAVLSTCVSKSMLSARTHNVIHQLFRLHSLHILERESVDFMESGVCTIQQVRLVREKINSEIFASIRPHAIALVDAWKFPDWQLDSSLGRYDGKVYDDMFHRASELNPLNAIVFDPYPNSPVLFRTDDRCALSSKI